MEAMRLLVRLFEWSGLGHCVLIKDASSLLHDCSILDKVAQVENIVISQVEVVLEQAEVVMNQKDWLPGAEVKNDNVAKWSDKPPVISLFSPSQLSYSIASSLA